MVGTDCPDSERAICRKLQIALSGSGQSVPTLVDTSVHILGCTQLVNVSSNHATVNAQAVLMFSSFQVPSACLTFRHFFCFHGCAQKSVCLLKAGNLRVKG